MANIILFKPAGAQPRKLNGSVYLSGPVQGDAVLVNELIVDDRTRAALPLKPVSVSLDKLDKRDGEDFMHFKKLDASSGPFDFDFELQARVKDQAISFLGFIEGAIAEVSFTLKLFVPKSGDPQPPDRPFMRLTLCGRLAMFAATLLDFDNLVCYDLTLQEVPQLKDVAPFELPALGLSFPKLKFKLPTLRLPNWHLPTFPSQPFKLPAVHLESLADALPFRVSWESVDLSFKKDADPTKTRTKLVVTKLRVAARSLPQLELVGTLTLVFDGRGKLVAGESQFERDKPKDVLKFQREGLFANSECLAVNWQESSVDSWLRGVAPGLFTDDSAVTDITARVLFGAGGKIREVRFDWSVVGADAKVALPGLSVELPQDVRYTLLLLPGDGDTLNRVALCTTLEEGAAATLKSNFAIRRGEEREVHNDPDQKSLFELKATVKKGTDPAKKKTVTLALVDFKAGEAKLPTFLQQLADAITPLDLSKPAELKEPTKFVPGKLQAANWDVNFKVNLPEKQIYKLPFLRLLKEAGEKVEQAIEVAKAIQEEFNILPPFETVKFPLPLRVSLDKMELDTVVYLVFSLKHFAITFEGLEEVELFSDMAQLPEGNGSEVLGLSWSFKGKQVEVPKTDGTTEPPKRFHYFTLGFKDSNYRLGQAPGSTFIVSYTKASQDPIKFAVTDFALTPKGIDLKATVVPSPVRLNGIDTKFCFEGSQLVVRENRITDFTLSGSGPLPPELVGEATAVIALQFKQKPDGGLTLAEGYAKLKAQKLLECQQTRFRFSIDALGLKFVFVEGRFHLYFTLTGSAEFKPAPGDGPDWALALLGRIKIDLVDAPLARDVRVLARHIRFLVELPTPKSFNFLGCFEMELRGIGFMPQAEVFNNDPAMILTGQVKFVQGPGDTPDNRVNYHTLYVGWPEPGSILPRIHFKDLPLNINLGAAFRLNGVLEFFDNSREKGFSGEGVLQIQGLPTLAAAFAFLRVREDENSPWLRAWFIFLEVRQVSFPIPVLKIFIREIGLGFGYRYTLASIKKADEVTDVRALLQELTKLSRTQGDLSKRDRWTVDLEKGGGSPHWTVVFRALISQASAAPSPLTYNALQESTLDCIFLFDVVVALRSDLTFFMAARGWLNTNYHDYFTNNGGIKERPLLSGFVLLSPRQKRFLAHVASNPNGMVGSHPELPEFVKKAITGAQFSATLLIEPGLLHYELGWPNMLRWTGDIGGKLKAEFRGGFIFRVSRQELVIGSSYLARASLRVEAELDLGFFGVRVTAGADAAFGARYIGVVDFRNPASQSAVYGAIGLELRIFVEIEAWIHIELFLTSIDISYRLSASINFTAGLEVGLAGLSPTEWGMRGSGTLALSVLGHDLHIGARLGFNEDKVSLARARTERFLQIGLEATDIEAVPGVTPQQLQDRTAQPANASALAPPSAPPVEPPAATHETADETGDTHAGGVSVEAPTAPAALDSPPAAADFPPEHFDTPDYSIFVIRAAAADGLNYFVLFPQGRKPKKDGEDREEQERGFLPVPPAEKDAEGKPFSVVNDFEINIPDSPDIAELQHYDPEKGFQPITAEGGAVKHPWRVNWEAMRAAPKRAVNIETNQELPQEEAKQRVLKLKDYLATAFVPKDPFAKVLEPNTDPKPLPLPDEVEDNRVKNPTTDAFESAVRGALEQFESSPLFKKDHKLEYEKLLDAAFQDETTVYHDSGTVPTGGKEKRAMLQEQQAWQIRGMVVQEIVGDLKLFAEGKLSNEDKQKSVPFQMGLVFSYKDKRPNRDTLDDFGDNIKLRQRGGRASTSPDSKQVPARVFNIARTSFAVNSPRLVEPRPYSNSTTIAVAWDLAWDLGPTARAAQEDAELLKKYRVQDDPEHHLLHYRVQRKALDGAEPDADYTVKNAAALHRKKEGNDQSVLKCIRTRFQLVDHFGKEAAEDQFALPAEGRTYVYTITPIDTAGGGGKPATIVVTRMPDAPPLVPTDGKLIVQYELHPEDFPKKVEPPAHGEPKLVAPGELSVQWTEQGAVNEQATPPVAEYFLVFRRERTLPIGSYGLDSATQRPRQKSLPTSNARPLPTDIKIKLGKPQPIEPSAQNGTGAGQASRPKLVGVSVSPADLKGPDIIPREGLWRPEAWRVFMQTVSVNGVASALAPVQIQLDFQTPAGRDQRQPGELEWLPRETWLPLLPPEDQRAVTGTAFSPMPQDDPKGSKGFTLSGAEDDDWISHALYQRHPEGLRCVRFRWNQGAAASALPLDLNAGYHLLELDIDAHTNEVFTDGQKLGDALRTIQEAQLLPPDELALTPDETLNVSQWEAWYPSTVRRGRLKSDALKLAQRSESPLSAWYSWRESFLVWPEWPGFTGDTDEGRRASALHLFLQEFLFALTDDPRGREVKSGGEVEFFKHLLPTFNLSLQASPPTQPGNLAAFFKATAPKSDPYGWGVLQRFGLSVACSLRYAEKTQVGGHERQEGEVVTSEELLKALRYVRGKYERQSLTYVLDKDDIKKLDEKLKKLIADLGARLEKIADRKFFGRLDFNNALLEQLGAAILGISVPDETGGGSKTVAALIAEAAQVKAPESERFLAFFKHLHFELLFQPGRSVELGEAEADSAGLLATVQMSLRPAVCQRLLYRKLVLDNRTLHAVQALPESENLGAGAKLKVTLTNKSGRDIAFSLINSADPNGGQQEITRPKDQSIDITFNVPVGGRAVLLFRVPEASAIEAVCNGKRLTFEAVEPTDEAAHHFEVEDAEAMAKFFGVQPSGVTPGQHLMPDAQWRIFKRYAEALNSTDTSLPADSRIAVPVEPDKLKEVLPSFIAWAQRFFDYGGVPKKVEVKSPDDTVDLKGQTTDGPWLATAYPRAGSPLALAPDAGGRLTYDHLLSDGWAHNYRYYIRPYGRYDMLWQSLRQKHLFDVGGEAARVELLPPAMPDPKAGGLDVVLDRVNPVAAPLVLNTARLDARSTPGQLAPPGRLWEVIVAAHPEQTLVERNQTLMRQLAFRGVAFAMLRRFAFPGWREDLVNAVKRFIKEYSLTVETVENHFPPAPTAYPTDPEHLQLTSEEQVRSIGLPERSDSFQQGVLALQWAALPFYYEHALLLVAQTAGAVSSRVNSVVQRDFMYQTPEFSPREKELIRIDGGHLPFKENQGAPAHLTRLLSIPLLTFWQSLPKEAQDHWHSESPDQVSDKKLRRLSSLPDREVVYQIIENFSGNIEVQAEIFFNNSDKPGERGYFARPLGQRWEVDKVNGVDGIQVKPPADDDPQADFILMIQLRHKNEPVKAGGLAYTSFHTGEIDLGDLKKNGVTDFVVKPADFGLVWFGRMSDTEKKELLDVEGDALFHAGLVRLSLSASSAITDDAVAVESMPLGVEELAARVGEAVKASIIQREGENRFRLAWKGPLEKAQEDELTKTATADSPTLSPEDKKRLSIYATQPGFPPAVGELLGALKSRVVRVVLPAGLPQPSIPDVLKGKLEIVTATDPHMQWTGPHNAEQLKALGKAFEQLPADFKTALDELKKHLDDTVVGATVFVRRPEQGELNEKHPPLKGKLLLGRAKLEVKELLSEEQANALRKKFNFEVDQKAVKHDSEDAVFDSLARRFGSNLSVRARRGSATVGEAAPVKFFRL